MTRKRRKKEGISLKWLRIVAMALVFFLGVAFFSNIAEHFLEETGSISTTGLIFGMNPVVFYLLMLCLMALAFFILAGSYHNAKKELLEKLD